MKMMYFIYHNCDIYIYILIICILYCSILLFLIGYRQYQPHAFYIEILMQQFKHFVENVTKFDLTFLCCLVTLNQN